MRFRFRNSHSIRDVGWLFSKKRSLARELASLDVRYEEPQPQTINPRRPTAPYRLGTSN
jgi:hypothetical protein